jgi:WD40 repeat protein
MPCGWLGVGWVIDKLQFSPDGAMLGVHDGRHVKLLRASDWAPLHALPPLASDVVDFAFTADDTVAIAAALTDPDAGPSDNDPAPRRRVHRLADGSILGELSDPDDPAGTDALTVALASSRDGAVLASAQRDLSANTLSVSIWSMPEQALVATVTVEVALTPVYSASLAVSPDGAHVAVSTAGQAHVLDASTGAELAVIDSAGGSLAFSPDGQYLAAGGVVVDVGTGAPVLTASPDDPELAVALNEASAVAFSADSSLLFIGTRRPPGERALLVRTVEGNVTVPSFEKGLTTPEPAIVESDPQYFGISALALAPDGELLVSVGSDAMLEAWQTSDGARVRSITGHVNAVDALAISGDRSALVSGANRPDTLLWSLSGASAGTSTASFEFPARALGLSDDGSRLMQLSDRDLSVVSTSDAAVLQAFDATDFDEAALSPDGTLLARGHRDGTIDLVGVADGAVVHELSGLDRESRGLAFSRDGSKLAAASFRSVAVWSTGDGSLIQATEIFSERVVAGLTGLAFSPDGSSLALVGGGVGPNLGEASFLLLLQADTGARGAIKLAPWIRDLNSAAFSPDVSLLATFAGLDGGIVWDADASVPLYEIDSVGPAAAFLSNDELATAEDNGSIARWCLGPNSD